MNRSLMLGFAALCGVMGATAVNAAKVEISVKSKAITSASPTLTAEAAGRWVQSGRSLGCTKNFSAPTGPCNIGASATSFAGPGPEAGHCPPGESFGHITHWSCEASVVK
jgi:hypothetical protein